MAKRKQTKGQTVIYKTLHREVQIEQHEPHKNRGWNYVFNEDQYYHTVYHEFKIDDYVYSMEVIIFYDHIHF